jgi:hypothetical protein
LAAFVPFGLARLEEPNGAITEPICSRKPGLGLVPQAGGQFIQQSIATVGGLQQQSSTVGTAFALITLGNDGLAENSWKQ